MSEYYAEIVPRESVNSAGSVTTINKNDATRYENLQSIALPANGGNLDWTQTIVLTHSSGGVERLEGHLISSGVIQE